MMGILWFDNDPKTTLDKKIAKALECHRHKFGRDAQVVMINKNAAESEDLEALSKACNATVKPMKYVLPNHFWVGFEDQNMELAG